MLGFVNVTGIYGVNCRVFGRLFFYRIMYPLLRSGTRHHNGAVNVFPLGPLPVPSLLLSSLVVSPPPAVARLLAPLAFLLLAGLCGLSPLGGRPLLGCWGGALAWGPVCGLCASALLLPRLGWAPAPPSSFRSLLLALLLLPPRALGGLSSSGPLGPQSSCLGSRSVGARVPGTQLLGPSGPAGPPLLT